jgi:hypothetical protein
VLLVQTLALRSYLRDQHAHLTDFLQRFGELVTLRSDDSIAVALQRISERTGQEVVDKDLFAFVDQHLSDILLRLSDLGKGIRLGEFRGMLNDLSTQIRFCSHFYFKKPIQVKGIAQVTAEERRSLELARENFADFVRRYQTFYDSVHIRIGSSVRAHFEIPKPLD